MQECFIKACQAPDEEGNCVVIVCNVVVLNMLPVFERTGGAWSLSGRPCVPSFDCHGVFIQRDAGNLPGPPETWNDRTASELVMFHPTHILPRCIIAIRPRPAGAAAAQLQVQVQHNVANV